MNSQKTKFLKYYRLNYNHKPAALSKSFRLWFQIIRGIFGKYSLRIVFIAFLLIFLAFVVKSLILQLPVFKTNLVIGVVGEYTLNNLPQSLTHLYSSGLTKIEIDGQVVPALADWKTEDGKKFTFVLKENSFWQDGKKIKASNLEFSNPNVQVNIIDEKTFEFQLASPFSPFLATLTKPVFRKNSNVGTGPYKLAKVITNGEILKQINLAPAKNNLPEITIRFFPNLKTAIQAFKTGQVGLLFNLQKLNGLQNWKGTEIIETFDPTKLVAVFYNTKDSLLENNKIRKALDLAIDRGVFKRPVTTSLPPGSWVGVKNDVEFDLPKAAKLLKSEEIAKAKLQVLTPSTFKPIIEAIVSNWEKLGFKIEIVEIDEVPNNFQAAIFGLEVPSDPDQYIFWHSTQSDKLTKIEDPKLDKLLEDGRKALKLSDRQKIYQEFAKELRNLTPASFLFFQDRFIVINKNSDKKLEQIRKYFGEFPVN